MPELSELAEFIKICGVTSVDDAGIVIDAKATALGLTFAESRRKISVGQAREISDYAKGRILRVGVFRDSAPELIVRAVESVELDAVQIHGDLDEDVLVRLRALRLSVVKALAIGSREFYEFDESRVDAVLVDGPTPGSGAVHSWDALKHRDFARPVIAAGGLSPSNVADVLATFDVWGVDVATGVEMAPGVKDPKLVMDFVTAAQHHFDQRKERRD